jgi:PAS domain S-box-containing protein
VTRGESTSDRIAELEAELVRLRAERAEALADGAMLKTLLETIAERRSTEDKLDRAREWLHLAQEAGRVCAYSIDFSTNTLHWSNSTLALYGIPDDETPTIERWLAAIHPDDRPRAEAVASATMEHLLPVDHRFRIILPGGGLRWIQDRGRVLSDEEGRPVRLVGINIDITDLVALEQRASEDGERLRLALAAGANACWEWDLATNKVTWDDRLAELTGIPNSGGSFEDFWALLHEEDKPKIRGALDAAIAGTRDYAVEFRMMKPDGGIRYTFTQAGVIRDEAGRAVRMVGIDTDITHRKSVEIALSESRLFLGSVLAASPDCVKVVEADGTLSYMNDNGVRLMEVPDFGQLLGRLWSDAWPARHKPRIDAALARALRGERASFEGAMPDRLRNPQVVGRLGRAHFRRPGPDRPPGGDLPRHHRSQARRGAIATAQRRTPPPGEEQSRDRPGACPLHPSRQR